MLKIATIDFSTNHEMEQPEIHLFSPEELEEFKIWCTQDEERETLEQDAPDEDNLLIHCRTPEQLKVLPNQCTNELILDFQPTVAQQRLIDVIIKPDGKVTISPLATPIPPKTLKTPKRSNGKTITYFAFENNMPRGYGIDERSLRARYPEANIFQGSALGRKCGRTSQQVILELGGDISHLPKKTMFWAMRNRLPVANSLDLVKLMREYSDCEIICQTVMQEKYGISKVDALRIIEKDF